MRRLLMFLPLGVVAILGGFFLWGLNPDRDPGAIPSALVGGAVPAFELAAVPGVGVPGLAKADLEGRDAPSVVNVFASWCVPCRAEHKVLTRLARSEGFDLMGVNYKDKGEDAARWLAELGNPYTRIGWDNSGRIGIEWGISGVPETFVIDAGGQVRWRFVGPIVTEEAQQQLRDALAEAAS